MEGLAEGGRVRIVAALYAALAVEPRFRDLGIDGVVIAWGARHRHPQHVNPGHDHCSGSGGRHWLAVAGQQVGSVLRNEVGNWVAVRKACFQDEHT